MKFSLLFISFFMVSFLFADICRESPPSNNLIPRSAMIEIMQDENIYEMLLDSLKTKEIIVNYQKMFDLNALKNINFSAFRLNESLFRDFYIEDCVGPQESDIQYMSCILKQINHCPLLADLVISLDLSRIRADISSMDSHINMATLIDQMKNLNKFSLEASNLYFNIEKDSWNAKKLEYLNLNSAIVFDHIFLSLASLRLRELQYRNNILKLQPKAFYAFMDELFINGHIIEILDLRGDYDVDKISHIKSPTFQLSDILGFIKSNHDFKTVRTFYADNIKTCRDRGMETGIIFIGMEFHDQNKKMDCYPTAYSF